ncbi:sensor histidine kinase [Halobacteriovorax sp.]|uniref:sensor histidine kinase n=1 Tax=Halobacteriovorax sp. TaxID=2020862 RepID=UPI003568A9A3
MKKNRSLIILTTLLVGTTLALAIWWTYLLYVFGDKLEVITQSIPDIGFGSNIIRMLKWEASTFIILILFLTISFLIVFFKDHRKTKALQSFFASLTHELKTPLASIRLQSEVITDVAETLNSERLVKLTSRLIEDTANLETQMDKILQLSRLERGGTLNLKPIDLLTLVNKISNNYKNTYEVKVVHGNSYEVLGDELAVELSLKNLFENTKNHTSSEIVQITIDEIKDLKQISLEYKDQGTFTGDRSKLGTIFYKHNSKKGSGIGLYLIMKFMGLMNGKISFGGVNSLETTLTFNKVIK